MSKAIRFRAMGFGPRGSPLEALRGHSRWLLQVNLAPLQGLRFQPTGFPDLGPALYPDPDGHERLIVESAQSMANHLESVTWDSERDEIIEPLSGLSYVRVIDDAGTFATSSVLEPHRLDSPFVLADGQVRARLERELKKGTAKDAFDYQRLPYAVFGLDVGGLVHGVFLQNVSGSLRIPRSLSAFIEASHVQVVTSGGVKRGALDLGTRAASSSGLGQVIFHREEFVAKTIRAYFSLDLAQIRGYGLAEAETSLVILLALYKVRRLLDHPLRLRSACDLEVVGSLMVRPDSAPLPSLDELQDDLRRAITACTRLEVLTVRHAGPR